MSTPTRDAFGEAILEAGADERVVILTGDLRDSTRTEDFAAKYPERFIECGIAESNMVGVASGLALSGKIPWACSFSCFVTGRFEQIRLSVAYQQANVRIVGTHSGIGVGEDGYSQMALEDIAALRALPNMMIVNPADAAETKLAVAALLEHEGPAFLRLTRQGVADVTGSVNGFELGKARTLRDGGDVALLATGATVAEAMTAAETLAGGGIEARVVDVHTLKPLDDQAVLEAASGRRAVVTIEDHSVVGGLGSAVAEALATEGAPTRLLRIGTDTFGESGSPKELYEKYGLAGGRVAERVSAFLDKVG